MEYVNFDSKIHDINKIAKLQYDVDFRTYDKLFDSKEKAIKVENGKITVEIPKTTAAVLKHVK